MPLFTPTDASLVAQASCCATRRHRAARKLDPLPAATRSWACRARTPCQTTSGLHARWARRPFATRRSARGTRRARTQGCLWAAAPPTVLHGAGVTRGHGCHARPEQHISRPQAWRQRPLSACDPLRLRARLRQGGGGGATRRRDRLERHLARLATARRPRHTQGANRVVVPPRPGTEVPEQRVQKEQRERAHSTRSGSARSLPVAAQLRAPTTPPQVLNNVSHARVVAMRRAMATVWERLLWTRAHGRPYLGESGERDAFASLVEVLRARLRREGCS